MTATPKAQTRKPPFRGKPATRFGEDDSGNLTITVHARALHPLMLRFIRWISLAAALGALVLAAMGLYDHPQPSAEDVAWALGGVLLTYPVLRYSLAALLKFRKVIRFTPEAISIKKGFGWDRYERRHPHSFTLYQHDDAEEEQQKLAFRNSRNPPRFWFLRPNAYYDVAFHICLDYFGERQDIMTVYGVEPASKIHARLMACDDVMEGETQGDGGVTLTPDRDWDGALGRI